MSKFDWERIEADYRLGKYSLRELSSLHGPSAPVIAKRAKKYGWIKDLTKVIAQGTKAEVIARQVAQRVTEGNEKVTNSASVAIQINADVVESHARGLATLKGVVQKLAEEMVSAAEAAPLIEPEELVSLAEAKGLDPASLRNLLTAAETSSRAATADKLAAAWAKLVPLERKTHGLDADDSKVGDAEAVLVAYRKLLQEEDGDA